MSRGARRSARSFRCLTGVEANIKVALQGLTSQLFWQHSAAILAASRALIDEVIADILASSADPVPSLSSLSLSSTTPQPSRIRGTPLSIIYSASASSLPASPAVKVTITASRSPPPPSSDLHSPTHLFPRTGKQGYPLFFSELDSTVGLVQERLKEGKEVMVVVEPCGERDGGQGEANDLGSALVVAVLGTWST